jgi:hypothetical protein
MVCSLGPPVALSGPAAVTAVTAGISAGPAVIVVTAADAVMDGPVAAPLAVMAVNAAVAGPADPAGTVTAVTAACVSAPRMRVRVRACTQV